MKQSLLILALFLGIHAQAQDHKGIYLIPHAGVSVGGFKAKERPSTLSYNPDGPWSYKNGWGYNVGLTVGYERRLWSVNTGITFLNQSNTGSYHGVYVSQTTSYSEDATETIHFKYLLFPLSFNYRQQLMKNRLWLVPGVGVELGRNIARIGKGHSQSITQTNFSNNLLIDSNARTFSSKLKKDELGKLYNRNTTWIMAKLDVVIATSAYRAITIGPEFHYMLSPLSKPNGRGDGSYSFAINFGYKLCRH